MKLTKHSLKIGLNYIVISGETNKIKSGDTIMVKFETRDSKDKFTVFRWKRKDEEGNQVWHNIDTIDKALAILKPFEFEEDREFAKRQIYHHQLEIVRIAKNYGLYDFLQPFFDERDYKDNWSLSNFMYPNGTMKDIVLDRMDKK